MSLIVGPRSVTVVVGLARVSVAVIVVLVLVQTFVGSIAVGDANPFDYFGYFTNQTSLLMSIVLAVAGIRMISGRRAPSWLARVRGVGVTCLIVVAVIYNTLVPGTGTAPAWVSAILHVYFPLFVVLDWLIIGDRRPLPWNGLWIVLPYPLIWLAVILVRGATDGWVPYGFLLPEHGVASLLAYTAGLLVALVASGAAVWAGSRSPGFFLRRAVIESSRA